MIAGLRLNQKHTSVHALTCSPCILLPPYFLFDSDAIKYPFPGTAWFPPLEVIFPPLQVIFPPLFDVLTLLLLVGIFHEVLLLLLSLIEPLFAVLTPLVVGVGTPQALAVLPLLAL